MTTENIYRRHTSSADLTDDPLTTQSLLPTQETAIYLYNLGLNIFPQPYGRKAGLPWKQLQYVRLHPNHPVVGIQALTAGKCNIAVMCGSTSGNLFVIDCETILALNTQIGYLRKRGIPLWIVETARGGHIYLRCTDGEIANVESGILPDVEIRGCRGYVLAAGSVHPTGAVYRWHTREGDTPPTVSAKTIDWLHDKNGKPIKLKLTRTTKRKSAPYNPLSRATQDYLANGDLLGQGSRNNRLFNAACDMAGNRYAPPDIERKLAPIAESSGLPRYEVYATLHSAFSRDRQPAKPHQFPTRKPQAELWQHARTFAETYQWQGRSSTTDKLVFLALTERARTANENGIFRASLREISVLARTSVNPIRNALERLKTAQFIFYAGEDKTSQASLWRFSNHILKEGQEKGDTFPPVPHWTSWSVSPFHSTDAAERGALGYTGLSVYRTLVEAGQPSKPSALAVHMRIPVHRVNYAFKKLREYGLVHREQGGWRAIAVSDAELDERVAKPAGKLGRGATRRERYAAERAVYVGSILLRARLEMFQEDFLCQARDLPLNLSTEVKYNASTLKIWRCLNCGQQFFGDEPPSTCDFCRDLTTWGQLDKAEQSSLSEDPVIQMGMLLGGVTTPPD